LSGEQVPGVSWPQIRHHHQADFRTRTDVLLTGELSALDF
jgi:hypothetical protein